MLSGQSLTRFDAAKKSKGVVFVLAATLSRVGLVFLSLFYPSVRFSLVLFWTDAVNKWNVSNQSASETEQATTGIDNRGGTRV